MPDTQWRLNGRCFKFGDDLAHDGAMMPFKYVIERVYDAAELVPHLFEEVDTSLSAQFKPGDILVAGKNFGKGKPHVQAYIALRALGVGVVCESMPFLSYRAAIGRGLLFLTDCTGASTLVEQGDHLEVDFSTGEFHNHTQRIERQFPPLPAALKEMVELGGINGVLQKWWEANGKAA